MKNAETWVVNPLLLNQVCAADASEVVAIVSEKHDAERTIERARLIAAAPELLEALETARNGLQWYQDTYPEAASGCDDEAMAQIDSALAKATGAEAREL